MQFTFTENWRAAKRCFTKKDIYAWEDCRTLWVHASILSHPPLTSWPHHRLCYQLISWSAIFPIISGHYPNAMRALDALMHAIWPRPRVRGPPLFIIVVWPVDLCPLPCAHLFNDKRTCGNTDASPLLLLSVINEWAHERNLKLCLQQKIFVILDIEKSCPMSSGRNCD